MWFPNSLLTTLCTGICVLQFALICMDMKKKCSRFSTEIIQNENHGIVAVELKSKQKKCQFKSELFKRYLPNRFEKKREKEFHTIKLLIFLRHLCICDTRTHWTHSLMIKRSESGGTWWQKKYNNNSHSSLSTMKTNNKNDGKKLKWDRNQKENQSKHSYWNLITCASNMWHVYCPTSQTCSNYRQIEYMPHNA